MSLESRVKKLEARCKMGQPGVHIVIIPEDVSVEGEEAVSRYVDLTCPCRRPDDHVYIIHLEANDGDREYQG